MQPGNGNGHRNGRNGAGSPVQSSKMETSMKKRLIFFLAIFILSGCGRVSPATPPATTPPTPAAMPPAATAPADPSFLSAYAFPASIDPSKPYLFYLHGKIVEDQGLHAVSPEYGAYEYEAILKKLAGNGFVVISEQREKNADGMKYADRVVQQARKLMEAGVPARNITIVGASKGGAITLAISHLLGKKEVNFVILGNCDSETTENFERYGFSLLGNVLTIRDSIDAYAGSCQRLFDYSEGKGLARYDEIVLDMGASHGLVYKPLDEWITPILQFTSASNSILGIDGSLRTGQSLVSANGLYTLTLQPDGNLVLYYQQTLLWASDTVGTGANHLRMGRDGNLVLSGSGSAMVWSSNTSGKGAANLVLQDDGNLVIYTLRKKTPVWSTRTPLGLYVSRAKVWVDKNVRYDQNATAKPDGTRATDHTGYRTDCSGFISMAWGLTAEGRAVPDTVRLANYAKTLDGGKDALAPGDIINNRKPGNKGHVLMFVGWIDKEAGAFVAYELQCGWDGKKCTVGQAVQTTRTLVWLSDMNGWGIEDYKPAYNPWYLERKK